MPRSRVAPALFLLSLAPMVVGCGSRARVSAAGAAPQFAKPEQKDAASLAPQSADAGPVRAASEPSTTPPEPTRPSWEVGDEQLVTGHDPQDERYSAACAAIVEYRRRALKNIPSLECAPGAEGGFDAARASRKACLAVPGGRAWGIVLERVSKKGDTIHALGAAAFAEPGRVLAVSEEGFPFFANPDNSTWYDIVADFRRGPTLLFDFDGDGIPEWLHSVGFFDHGSGEPIEMRGQLWSYRNGRVTPSTLAHIRIVQDLDGDGRPDLLIAGPFAGPWTYENGPTYDVETARLPDWGTPPGYGLFAAHSLPDGTFSTTDDIAKAHLRTWCSRPPDLGKVKDCFELRETIPCARAWQIGPADIERVLRRVTPGGVCPGYPNSIYDGGRINAKLLRSWVRARAPLTMGGND